MNPPRARYDAGTELRRRLGLPEPSYVTHPGQPLTMEDVEAAVEAARAAAAQVRAA